jgi:hypothetical protein
MEHSGPPGSLYRSHSQESLDTVIPNDSIISRRGSVETDVSTDTVTPDDSVSQIGLLATHASTLQIGPTRPEDLTGWVPQRLRDGEFLVRFGTQEPPDAARQSRGSP